MADHPLRPAKDRRLGRPLPYQLPNLAWAHLMARGPKIPRFGSKALCGISHRFQWLSPSKRQIPKYYSPVRRSSSSSKLEILQLDLHVLSLPPAFNLSHDQTLQFKILMQVSFRTVSPMNVWFLLFCKALPFKSSTGANRSWSLVDAFLCKCPHRLLGLINC